jgi:DNA uptake protein ComE-like DNA-binding protein
MWLLSCVMACLALGGVLGIALYQTAHSSVFLADASAPSESAGPIDAQPPAPDGRIDPNTAQWHDLTPLPRVGEALARRIVAYREAKTLEWRSAHPREPVEHTPPVFITPEDLLPVKGIGPKTLDLLRPHLRWPEKAPALQVAPQAK